MSQPLVLAIEPDLRQAAIVKRIVREKALADVVVVDSRDAAIDAMRTSMPDVLLLSALLSPRDEDELMAHLRTLDNAAHLQTHTIPQLASTLDGGEERGSRGLLSAFRRKKEAPALVGGCDPDMFADEIRSYLQRAADRKRLLQTEHFVAPDIRPRGSAEAAATATPDHEEPAAAESSSWASPFEWKPASRKKSAKTETPPPPAAAPMTAPAAASVVMPPPAPAPAPDVAPAVAAAVESLILPKRAEEPPLAVPVAAEPAISEPVAPAPIASAPADVEPASVVLPKVVDTPRESPALHATAHIDAAPVEAPVPITKSKPVDPPRPKAVAERGPKLTGRMQIQDLLNTNLPKESTGRDRLGSLARWVRTEPPRPTKGGAVTSEDVRTLIASLAVPAAVASVTYPQGCRLRRVRVPVLPEQPAA